METVTLENTLDLIDIRGQDFDTLVLSRGKPLAINWPDCAGSVAQYLVRAGTSDYDTELTALRHTLDGNLSPDQPLSVQFSLFLQLLSPAQYYLSINTYNTSDIIDCQTEWSPHKDYDNFYPSDPTLVLTQATSTLKANTIEAYRKKIKAGLRPILLAVTTEDGWCHYVIDGHHKALAYRQQKVKPKVLTACRLSAPSLPNNTFSERFSPAHPLALHYQKHKAKSDQLDEIQPDT